MRKKPKKLGSMPLVFTRKEFEKFTENVLVGCGKF